MSNPQPNADMCFVCGRSNPRGLYMRFYDDGDKTVWSDYTVDEIYQGYPGVVHGGIVAAMLDEVVGRVSMIEDHHHFMMTVKLEVKYRKPVPTQTMLRVEGRLERMSKRMGRAVGEIKLPDGSVAAEASIVLAQIPKEVLSVEPEDLESLGWRVDE